MYISNNKYLGFNETPVWEENDLHYNYNKENLREKVLYFDIDQLVHIKKKMPSLFLACRKYFKTQTLCSLFPHLNKTL